MLTSPAQGAVVVARLAAQEFGEGPTSSKVEILSTGVRATSNEDVAL